VVIFRTPNKIHTSLLLIINTLIPSVPAGIYCTSHLNSSSWDWDAGMGKLNGYSEEEEEATAVGKAAKDDNYGHISVNEIYLSTRQKQQQQQQQQQEEGEDHLSLNKDDKKFVAIVTIHDVAPEYSEKIFRVADELEKLGIHYNLALVPYLKKRKDNLISRNPKFVNKVLGYKQEVALHGNYHETDDGKIEDFHIFSVEEAKKHLQNAINVLKEAGINTTIFVPPTWAINKPTIEDLIQLGFKLVEGKEEILIIDSKKTKRLHAGVLNWDQSGSPEKNRECLAKNKQLYELEVTQKNSRLVRIAIHPRDPVEALQDQIEMIQGLKDKNYSFLGYGEMIRTERGEIREEEEQQLLQQNLLGPL
jgi:predicted deacetylase